MSYPTYLASSPRQLSCFDRVNSGEAKHLNTPRQVYDDQAQLRWKWDQAEPFGVTTPDENPVNLGAFDLPIRFSGQYVDKETGLAQNWFRDYRPEDGRYVQSDLVGLAGGINTYAYVLSRPIESTDPSGRFPAGAHNSFSYTQAIGTCVQSQAVELGQKTGNADIGTQSREDAYKHNMCSPGMSQAACQAKISGYIDEQLSLCTLDGLANALHDIQDGYSPSHRGNQDWHGLPGTPGGESYVSMALHLVREALPVSSSPARATKATIQEWCQRCRRCK